ncbi:sulfite exporter TauE/SafE family protein [Peptococcus simiae]|uniref:sulfite exporter TauE/SafE family protein n=1 Tax=Peptococcus simiae TaxID=1643805 RepID=UPI0039814CEE
MFGIILVAAFLGFLLQRVSGTGFALVMVPVYTLFLGPVEGVVVSNILNGLGCLFLMVAARKDLQWKRVLILSGAAVLGMYPGIYLVKYLSPAFLQLSIGLIMLVALAISLGFKVDKPHKDGLVPLLLSGLGGGFLVTTAGIPAPAMVIYARYVNWDFRHFNAAMQGVFFLICTVTAGMKVASGIPFPRDIFSLSHNGLFLLFAFIGMGLGAWLSQRIPDKYAARLAFIVSIIGAALATGRGAWLLVLAN